MSEKINQPTPEEIAKMEKSRTISDAELLKKGAEYAIDEKGNKELRTTSKQIETIVQSGDYKPSKENNRESEIAALNRVRNRIEKLKESRYSRNERGWQYRGEIRVHTRKGDFYFENLETVEIIEQKGHYYFLPKARTLTKHLEPRYLREGDQMERAPRVPLRNIDEIIPVAEEP